jgi:hypothetical protein
MALPPLYRFKQGDHCCVFYDDEEALLDILVPYFADGLAKRERCFAAQTTTMARRLVDGLKKAGVPADRDIARGALTIVTLEDFYGNDATSFHPYALMARLLEFIDESLALGYHGTRTAGEMQFVVHNGVECEHLIEYERMVDVAFPGKQVLGLCQYNTRLFTPDTLRQAIAVHQQQMSNIPGSAKHASMGVRRGHYVLDIVSDRSGHHRSCYYVAEDHEKKNILGWGVAHNFDDAIAQGERLLQRFQS